MSEIPYLTDETFDAAIGSDSGVVLVDFTASWCGPCKALAPILEDMAGDPEVSFTILKVDIDESPATKERFGIRGVPTMILFEEGEPLTRIVGGRSKQQLLDTVAALV